MRKSAETSFPIRKTCCSRGTWTRTRSRAWRPARRYTGTATVLANKNPLIRFAPPLPRQEDVTAAGWLACSCQFLRKSSDFSGSDWSGGIERQKWH
ncbi:Fidgetin-like protein 1 [Clarias magur]|uniref:Fidgetin-like protein 1 n=1 Tax=Clarias magur TaxID=1594786 RepID=A0A8J4X3U4_CLAMG|nr:Fidgetin-like protein 1 [Clarias magur]